MLPIRTILHLTDFSEQAQHAFAAACSLAFAITARLVVLYVRAPAVIAFGELGPIVTDLVWTPADVKAGLSGLHLPDPGVEVEYRVAEGEPTAEIVRQAGVLGANLDRWVRTAAPGWAGPHGQRRGGRPASRRRALC